MASKETELEATKVELREAIQFKEDCMVILIL
jgi:hypothetical protein